MTSEYGIFDTLPAPEPDQVDKLIDMQYRKIASQRFGDLGSQLKQWGDYERAEHNAAVSDDEIIRSVAINDYVMDFVSLHAKKIVEGTLDSPALADIHTALREQFVFRCLMLATVRAFIDIYNSVPGNDNEASRVRGVHFVISECKDMLNERFGVTIGSDMMLMIKNKFYAIVP